MIEKLDKLDRDILYELGYNCRQPNSIIAKKLRRSKQVIRYRIKKLEEKGIISAYNSLIDFRVLGFNSLRIYFKLRNISPEKEKEMYEYMRKNDLFLWTVNLEGDVDIAFYVWVKDVERFYEKWEKFFELYRQYILKQEFYLSINMIHYPIKILKKPEVIKEWNIGKNKNRIKIDETDLAILKILSRHANKPIVDIGSEVGISAKLAAYRIKQLEKKKIILAHNAIIDETKIGYKMYKVDFYLFNHSKLKEMYQFAKQHPNIKNLMKTIGGPDFEIEVMVKDVIELRSIIDEIRTQFSEVIDYWRYNRFVETIKQVYLPIEIEL
ncbi:winged helix-turn-helix transcriptional regulator [Candidatus Woesearchaeota archaeon]|nr:winged helix-turn-helix transcriptional regulator [Candidatus Woesearchaeota archaeon]